MYLIDTNVLSEARRGRSEARNWLRSVHSDHVFLSVITLGEIMKGIQQKARTDPLAARVLDQWLERLRTEHADRILPIDDEVAFEWGRLAALRPRDMADALLGATAIVHRKTVVTRNVSDFSDIGVPLVDPWNLG